MRKILYMLKTFRLENKHLIYLGRQSRGQVFDCLQFNKKTVPMIDNKKQMRINRKEGF